MEVQVKKVWYNPAQAAFEGRVDIVRQGRQFRYPCLVKGPVDMPANDVLAQMKSQAASMTDSRPAASS
ncbi:orotidine 5'-phosphate decarboxylase [Loktanella sp. D2R18]|uniref:orotidine 5'-phosphate decarboxylase n=1 Tax=Rhodobacterales TaxID=204455 RepID=UPI000DEBBBE9|nr:MULTISPECIES: orotidine 5'-phosphate decarboxylase [Rhodobacterales]MDO6590335.1 orotidine 5'-phosphate decarboxylase [Yoonia sp. 1_MG-2023]RBW42862.1 orotidine 5'-phosphate decarboxylase [Loktanella sp. D2R18]